MKAGTSVRRFLGLKESHNSYIRCIKNFSDGAFTDAVKKGVNREQMVNLREAGRGGGIEVHAWNYA
jgi:hypothetical protein